MSLIENIPVYPSKSVSRIPVPTKSVRNFTKKTSKTTISISTKIPYSSSSTMASKATGRRKSFTAKTAKDNKEASSDVFVWKTAKKVAKESEANEVSNEVSNGFKKNDTEKEFEVRIFDEKLVSNGFGFDENTIGYEGRKNSLNHDILPDIEKSIYSLESKSGEKLMNGYSTGNSIEHLDSEVSENSESENCDTVTEKDNTTAAKDFEEISTKSNFPVRKSEKFDFEANGDEGKLREQIEKLSSFIESSENLRERSEMLLTQQKSQLESEIQRNDELANKVRCLEELRKKLQRKFDEKVKENMSLRAALKNTETRLEDTKARMKMVKKECSTEVSKNAELEVVLQTVLQELGSANKLLKMNSEKVYTWPWSKYGSWSADKEENWKRERSQFEGKIKLLEMDKKKLRYEIDDLKDQICEQEHDKVDLRENNEVLEFRIAELEIRLSEMMAKKLWT